LGEERQHRALPFQRRGFPFRAAVQGNETLGKQAIADDGRGEGQAGQRDVLLRRRGARPSQFDDEQPPGPGPSFSR
jgi:hypothetical protein